MSIHPDIPKPATDICPYGAHRAMVTVQIGDTTVVCACDGLTVVLSTLPTITYQDSDLDVAITEDCRLGETALIVRLECGADADPDRAVTKVDIPAHKVLIEALPHLYPCITGSAERAALRMIYARLIESSRGAR
jgi:hypothetical protein